MNVIIPALSGFCPGVKNAEKQIFQLKKHDPAAPLYVYGYLINNRNYIARLAESGVHTVAAIDDIPAGATAVIRTHGLDRREEAALRAKCRVNDLTCASVKKVQHEIEAHARDGFFIVIVGTADHPETKGHVSYSGECAVIERAEDCPAVWERLPEGRPKIFICAQTTAPRELFDLTVASFRTRAALGRAEIEVYDSICLRTDRKEQEALRLQRSADVTFVVGDPISANAKKLFRVLSSDAGRRAYFIENLAGLKALGPPLRREETALLVSSASTPSFLEQEIAEYLRSV